MERAKLEINLFYKYDVITTSDDEGPPWRHIVCQLYIGNILLDPEGDGFTYGEFMTNRSPYYGTNISNKAAFSYMGYECDEGWWDNGSIYEYSYTGADGKYHFVKCGSLDAHDPDHMGH